MKIFGSTSSRLRPLTLFIILMALIASLAGCGEKSYSIFGRIVDSDSNEGIPGVTIFTDSGLIAESAADGKYALTGLSGQVKIMFFKQDYGFDSVNVSAANANLVVKGTILEPPAETYQVSGRVVHLSSGLGISGVSVFAFASGQTATTGSNGEFTIDGLFGTNELHFFQNNWGFSPNPLVVSGAVAELIINCIPLPDANLADLKVACGLGHTILLRGYGTVWTCGDNEYGQLGNGTIYDSNIPVLVVNGLYGVVAIAAGVSNHSMALKGDGTVWAWGENYSGQLGNDTITDSNIPVPASGLSGVRAIGVGGSHSMALKDDGTLWAWGGNYSGELGNGTNIDSYTPAQVSGLSGVEALEGGGLHSLALKGDGTVWAWGNNGYGQLGNGTITDSNIPVPVSGLSGIVAIAGGLWHSIALKGDGTVWAWGYNGAGQLGTDTTTGSSIPIQISGLSGVMAIAVGELHSMALKDDGTVWAWGNNGSGQLGNGTKTNSYTPVQVIGLSGAVAIAGGARHSVALKVDNTLWAWGGNESGQFGDGSYANSLVPVEVHF